MILFEMILVPPHLLLVDIVFWSVESGASKIDDLNVGVAMIELCEAPYIPRESSVSVSGQNRTAAAASH